MILVCSAGMPGAGKEVLVTVAQGLGLPIVRMGDLVREEAEKRGLRGPDGVSRAATVVRQEEGTAAWARRLVPRLPPGPALVDGLRSLDELEVLQDLGRDVHVVAVHASRGTRYARLVDRARTDDVADVDWLRGRDLRELDYGLGGILAMADHVIVNEGTSASFEAAARDLLHRLVQARRPQR